MHFFFTSTVIKYKFGDHNTCKKITASENKTLFFSFSNHAAVHSWFPPPESLSLDVLQFYVHPPSFKLIPFDLGIMSISKQGWNSILWVPLYLEDQGMTGNPKSSPGASSELQLKQHNSPCVRDSFFNSQAVIVIVFVISRVHYHTKWWWPFNSYKKH